MQKGSRRVERRDLLFDTIGRVIIDGKKIAEEIITSLGSELNGRTLGVVMNTGDAASHSFVKMKERVALKLGVTLKRYTPQEFDEALKCDGVIVQLPLMGADDLIARLPPQKDVDALGSRPLVPMPIAEAISEILVRSNIAAAGKVAVVVGAGRLVGAPAKKLLEDLGAKVSVVTLEQGSLEELNDAEIIVSGAGSPGLIKPHMLKEGVVLIDAGTSEAEGRVVGDATAACAEVASVFTPVPGGIGPVAVAMIYKNLYELIYKFLSRPR